MEVNNAVYEPLAMSNDSDSCREDIIPSIKKKKKYRKKLSSLPVSSSSSWKWSLPASSKLWLAFISLCLIWLVLLTWFALNLHFQSSMLKGLLNEVAAGSEGVPDALQKCHSWSRQLQANQTLLFAHLATLSRQLENITSQIGIVQSGLTHVEEKLTSSPELINVPLEVQDLSSSVASFGSQIKDLQTSFNSIKEEQNSVLKLINSVKTNVTNINDTLNYFSKSYNASQNHSTENSCSAKVESTIDGINTKINSINETISHKIQWILTDQHKYNMAMEGLEEMSANISSRLTTVQNDCSAIETLAIKSNNMSLTISKNNQLLDEMRNQIGIIEKKINLIEGSSSKMMSDISDLKNVLPLHHTIEVETLPSTSSHYDSSFGPTSHEIISYFNESEQLNSSSGNAVGKNM